jgi:hypothetical protein
MQTRRGLLAGGSSAAALALAGLGYRAWDRGVWSADRGAAYAPWREWEGSATDGTKRPIRAAILASNPHDTQPWLFRVDEGVITLFADRARNLGSFDPFRREMYLGLGAAIENLVLAARAFGFMAKVQCSEGRLSPSQDDTPEVAARIALTPMSAARDSLFDAIPNRHTNRGSYRSDQAIGAERLRRLADLAMDDIVHVVFVEDRQARLDLGALIVEATSGIIADPQMSRDSAQWFRTGRREIAAHRDGVTIDTAGLSPLMAAVTKLLPDLDAPTADRYWLSTTREIHVPTAPVLGVIFVQDRLDVRSALHAGRAWQRLHLAITAEGLVAQPLNQPVECIDRDAMLGRADRFESTLAKFDETSNWQPTFVFRMGVAEHAAPPSPRRTLDAVLTT